MLYDESELFKLLRLATAPSKNYYDRNSSPITSGQSVIRTQPTKLGCREICKALRKEGIEITFYKTRKLMKKLKLIVKQRVA